MQEIIVFSWIFDFVVLPKYPMTKSKLMLFSFKLKTFVETSGDIGKGKCGFGGSDDTDNGYRTANGGINKDRLDPKYSPHHHLHYSAYNAAKKATELFLVDQGMFYEKLKFIKISQYHEVHKYDV